MMKKLINWLYIGYLSIVAACMVFTSFTGIWLMNSSPISLGITYGLVVACAFGLAMNNNMP
jgi:hypothetical protein